MTEFAVATGHLNDHVRVDQVAGASPTTGLLDAAVYGSNWQSDVSLGYRDSGHLIPHVALGLSYVVPADGFYFCIAQADARRDLTASWWQAVRLELVAWRDNAALDGSNGGVKLSPDDTTIFGYGMTTHLARPLAAGDVVTLGCSGTASTTIGEVRMTVVRASDSGNAITGALAGLAEARGQLRMAK